MVLRVFEMFAGYGGASWGLRKAGIPFECVGFSEIKKSAIKCYEQNFQGHKNFGDCTKIDPAELPDFDLLTGGFPCQTFSQAGERKGFEDARGVMFKEIVRIAEAKKPEYMLLENVEGLLTHESGHTLITIVKEIRRIGYDVQYKLLLSDDFGVPQNRLRVFFICRRKPFQFGESLFPEPIKESSRLKVKDIIKQGVEEEYYLSQEQIEKLKKRERFGDSFIIAYENERFDKVIVPCFTCVDTSNIYVIERESRFRRLTMNECMRLQGFAENELKFEGLSKNQMYDLFGDGWDVNLVSKIFRRMFA